VFATDLHEAYGSILPGTTPLGLLPIIPWADAALLRFARRARHNPEVGIMNFMPISA